MACFAVLTKRGVRRSGSTALLAIQPRVEGGVPASTPRRQENIGSVRAPASLPGSQRVQGDISDVKLAVARRPLCEKGKGVSCDLSFPSLGQRHTQSPLSSTRSRSSSSWLPPTLSSLCPSACRCGEETNHLHRLSMTDDSSDLLWTSSVRVSVCVNVEAQPK